MTEQKSPFDFHSKHELAANFSLDELLTLTRQRNLQEWLAVNFYAGEARKVSAALNDELDDAQLKLLLCKVFDLPLESLSPADVKEISSLVDKNHRRELFVEQIPGDDRKIFFAETQGELVKALDADAQLIYLCGGEFRIPLHRGGVTYVGCDNALVDLDAEVDVDLDACEIVLRDVQVYLHHAINLRAEKSANVKVIDGSRTTLGEHPMLKEIFDILRGRKAFESPAYFTARAENRRGVAVGVALLDEKNFDFDAEQFNFSPRWDFEYISVLKDFAARKIFFATICPADAERLYDNERKLQIFADFTARDGKLTIAALYFDTKTLGRIAITVRDKFYVGSSSMSELGYGLDIITAYDNNSSADKTWWDFVDERRNDNNPSATIKNLSGLLGELLKRLNR